MDGGIMEPLARARSLVEYPLATCLDGSAARYYVRPADPRRLLIFFEGWGYCKSMTECLARSRTFKGSTKDDPPSLQLNGRPYFRQDDSNPLLANFTTVFVRTCDGGYYSGSRQQPIPFNGTRLHFRGRWILEALLADLKTRQALYAATDIVIGGCSAGGIHVLAHLDTIRAHLPPSARVVGFVDSGFYLDQPWYSRPKAFVTSPTGMNASGMLNSDCIADYLGSPESCLIGQISSTYLRTPVFLWQSIFDTDQQECELSKACATQPACRAAYGANLSKAIHLTLLDNTPVRHGAFIDECNRHCDDGDPPPLRLAAIRADDGMNPLQAFHKWYSDTRRSSWSQYGKPTGEPITCDNETTTFTSYDVESSCLVVLLCVGTAAAVTGAAYLLHWWRQARQNRMPLLRRGHRRRGFDCGAVEW